MSSLCTWRVYLFQSYTFKYVFFFGSSADLHIARQTWLDSCSATLNTLTSDGSLRGRSAVASSSLSVRGVGVCILGTKGLAECVTPFRSPCASVRRGRLYVHQLCPLFYPPLCLFFSCFRLDSGPWTPNSDLKPAFILSLSVEVFPATLFGV